MVNRQRAEITRAFVDRAPIDWVALLERAADPGDREALDILRRLDALRGESRSDSEPEPPYAWTIVLRIVVVIGAVHTLIALAYFVTATANDVSTMDVAPHAAVAGVFVVASLLLASAISRDHRIFFLLATFVLTASAFARPLLAGIPPIRSTVMFRGVYPEAFAQAALWQFATVFPFVRRFTRFDVIARRVASAAGALAVALFLINVLLAHGWLPESFALLGRNHARRLYWQMFAGAALPALAVIVIRAWRAPWNERRKVVRFACAIGIGSGPLLALGVARTLPGVDPWMTATGIRPWADLWVMTALTAMPVLVTLAVVLDAPFELRRIVGLNHGNWVMRPVECVDAICARALRPRRHRERLSLALDRVRLARGSREITAVLQQELQVSVGARSVTVVQAGALPNTTALLPILQQSSSPIDLSRLGEPFVLLPREDREWLEASGVTLAAAVRLRDGTIPVVILFGHPLRKDSFDRSDRWFITTLLTGASAAWDAASSPTINDECADECVRCGRVRAAGTAACCTGAETRLAALPKQLRDRFVVTRRLGIGGMGVVYLGHDFTLGRDVALKTWAGLREEMMTRLCEEAHVMATLSHDAIATIYGLESWRRTPVLVMEYCAQGTLADVLARGPLALDDVLRLGIRLADALTYMHDRGVLHRDIKPSNIGLTAHGVAKLLDFGLAGADDQRGGTPAYLPPEVLQGAPPTAAVDLWGVATALREASASSGRLEMFFSRAFAVRPCDRFESAREMRDVLSRLSDEQR